MDDSMRVEYPAMLVSITEYAVRYLALCPSLRLEMVIRAAG